MAEKTLIEKAARALAEQHQNTNISLGNASLQPWRYADQYWRDYLPQAQAVIRSIRNPSEAMEHAGSVAGEVYQSVGCDAARCWRAMVDELLKEA